MTDLIDDVLFVALSGFAKSCLDSDPDSKLLTNVISKAVNKYFSKNMPFNKKRRFEIMNAIKSTLDPKLEELEKSNNGQTSPQILLILTLDYLVKEKKHLLTRMKFGHFNVDKLIDDIYSLDRYKPFLKSHSDFVVNF